MRVFLTGATGFIGSRIVPELIAAGHEVLGLARSDHGAEALARAGAEVHRGSLENPETLASGAAQADAVIHAAFDHDFANFLANCEKDRRVIEAMGDALAGSSKPFLITSGVGMGNEPPVNRQPNSVSIGTMPIRVASLNWPEKLRRQRASALRSCACLRCITSKSRGCSRR